MTITGTTKNVRNSHTPPISRVNSPANGMRLSIDLIAISIRVTAAETSAHRMMWCTCFIACAMPELTFGFPPRSRSSAAEMSAALKNVMMMYASTMNTT